MKVFGLKRETGLNDPACSNYDVLHSFQTVLESQHTNPKKGGICYFRYLDLILNLR